MNKKEIISLYILCVSSLVTAIIMKEIYYVICFSSFAGAIVYFIVNGKRESNIKLDINNSEEVKKIQSRVERLEYTLNSYGFKK